MIIVIRKMTLVVVLLSLLPVLAFFFRDRLIPAVNDTAPAPENTSEENQPHPYGRPAEGPLLWEEDEKFKVAYEKAKATSRLAAFQTTLPDPLPGEEYNVTRGAQILAGKVVLPGQVFSMNATVGPYNLARGFRVGPTYAGSQVITTIGGGICKVATTLYNVTVLADLPIIQRHAHGMLVPYVPPGQDATVSYGVRDFKFMNSTGAPLLIWAATRDNTLYIAFYGQKTPPRIIWHHEILGREKTWVEYRYNYQMKRGSETVLIPGEDGLTVKSWLTLEYPDGRKETRNLSVDYYRPMPRIIEKGMKQ